MTVGHRSALKLDTTSLGNAVRRLREGLIRCESEPTDEQIRDGLIQRFEFTYELSHKMLGRYLKETAASPDEIERMLSKKDRRVAGMTAPAHGLVLWKVFYKPMSATKKPESVSRAFAGRHLA